MGEQRAINPDFSGSSWVVKSAAVEAERDKAWADGATLTAEMLDAADLLDAQGSSIGNDLRKVANDHSPSAPMLDLLHAFEGLENAIRGDMPPDGYGFVSTFNALGDIDAIRNREGR